MTAIAKAVNIMISKGYTIIDINPCVGSTYADLFVVSNSDTAIAVVVDVRDNPNDASKAFSDRAKVAERLALVKATEMKLPKYRADECILCKNGCVEYIVGDEGNASENAVDQTSQIMV